MCRGVDLNGGAKQCEVPDAHGAHVEDHTIEVEEHALSKMDVRAVVAVEGRLHPPLAAAASEQLGQNAATLLLFALARAIECLAQIARPHAGGAQLGIH